ncbi:hypothetical protein HK100_005912, partial [Physocladia obscura]
GKTLSDLKMEIGRGGDILTGGGKQCAVETCRRLDFLPFACRLCNQNYCFDHRLAIHHVGAGCSGRDNTVVLCPICGQPVSGTSTLLTAELELNRIVAEHMDSGCSANNTNAQPNKNKCRVRKCNNKSLAVCRDCSAAFCAAHRFPADHSCLSAASLSSSLSSSPIVPSRQILRPPPNHQPASKASLSPKAKPVPVIPDRANPIPVVCPVCHKNVPGATTSMSPNDVNDIVARHIDAGCPKPKLG